MVTQIARKQGAQISRRRELILLTINATNQSLDGTAISFLTCSSLTAQLAKMLILRTYSDSSAANGHGCAVWRWKVPQTSLYVIRYPICTALQHDKPVLNFPSIYMFRSQSVYTTKRRP